MTSMKKLFVLALVLAFSGVAIAQDAVKVAPTHYKVMLDNASIRILKITYAAGDKSAMHSHPDSIVVPLGASKVKFTMPDGKSQDQEMASESALYTPAGTHSPANTGKTTVDAILVEFKGAAPGKATLPASRPGLTLNVLAEGPRGMAYRSTAAPTFEEAAGTKHDFDQVVISLGAAQMSLSIDGKPAKTTWARGDAVFVPRGTAHAAKNTSGKPIEFIIVAIK
jgi:quercetin dioxygenase-like cupin family protein